MSMIKTTTEGGRANVGEDYDFNLISLNTRGLNNNKKRISIFRWLKKEHCDIAFLQETYSGADNELEWQDDWGGTCLFAHGGKHSRGVLIALRKGLDYKVVSKKQDYKGRFLIYELEICDERLFLINLYAPNKEKEQCDFLTDLRNIMNRLKVKREDKIIIGGDWNIVKNINMDKKGGTGKIRKKVLSLLNELSDEFEIEDMWRIKNPVKRRYTWRQTKPLVQCRLDYFMISTQLLDNVEKITILPASLSDHSPIYASFKFTPLIKGPGFWKLNTSLLEDLEYIDLLTEMIEIWKIEFATLENKNLVWDLLKYRIRETSTKYSKAKRKEKRQKEEKLQQSLALIEEQLGENNTEENLKKYEKIKLDLNELYEEKVQGHIIRSRIAWSEEYEKSSSFFFNLEKRNFCKKNISRLKLDNGEETRDHNKIMEAAKDFYQELYSESEIDETMFNFFTINESIPKLSEKDKTSCEGKITLPEIKKVINTFKMNKTPGNDGIPVAFYVKFWLNLKISMQESFNYSYETGLLSNSQRQAIITLLEKSGKNRLLLKNWRPISLLNCDYKILTKCIAERLKKVIPTIIHHNQTGFVKGRNMSDSLRTLLDILDDTVARNISGMLMTIDFEKAFDSVNLKYLNKALESFNFGESVRKWVTIFYNNVSSCVMNKNATSAYFDISRGVRQGDPLSPLLFIISVELLAVNIRNNNNIKGIKFSGNEIKMMTYADDTTAVVSSLDDAKRFLKVVNDFSKASGLKINKEKSEALWLGSLKECNDKPMGIEWPEAIQILGIYISYNKIESLNKKNEEKIKVLKAKLNMWKRRNLTLTGKILILKTFGISQVLYLSSVFKVPEWALSEISKIMYEFLWNGKQNKVKSNVIIQNVKHGGFNMCDIESMFKKQQLKWVIKLFDDNQSPWKDTFKSLLSTVNIEIYLKGNYNVKEIPKQSEFYENMLHILKEIKAFNVEISDIYNYVIWYNEQIKVYGRGIFLEKIYQAGFERIYDLFDEQGNIITYNRLPLNVRECFDALQWNSLITAIPKVWKRAIRQRIVYLEKNNFTIPIKIEGIKKDLITTNLKLIYNEMVLRKQDTSKAQRDNSINYNIDSKEYECIYQLAHQLKLKNKLKEFQYKILNKYLPTNKLLYAMKKIDSPRCNFCFLYTQTISHLFYECIPVKNIWQFVKEQVRLKTAYEIALTERNVLFGIPNAEQDEIINSINKIILQLKYFIFKMKLSQSDLTVQTATLYLALNCKIRLFE